MGIEDALKECRHYELRALFGEALEIFGVGIRASWIIMDGKALHEQGSLF